MGSLGGSVPLRGGQSLPSGVRVHCSAEEPRFISGVPFSSMAMSMTLAPRIQIYTELACDQYKPEYSNGTVGVVANTISMFSESPVLQWGHHQC